MTELSQRDPRWANEKLGFSKTSTLGQYGCVITSISMAANITPNVLNNLLKAVGGFQDDLLIWSKVKECIPFDFSYPRAYDNVLVKKEIETNGFCLVKVDFDGKISSPSDTHYVLYIGNQQMIDPWTGVTKATSYYPLVTGFCPCKKVGFPTPPTPVITDDEKRTLDFLKQTIGASSLEGTVREWEGDHQARAGLESRVKQFDGLIETLKQEWHMPSTSSAADIISEALKLPIAEDRVLQYRDSIEECVGTFPSDIALLEAHAAVRTQIEVLVKERDALLVKLEEAKTPKGYKFLKSWNLSSLLFKLYKKT